jgi:hypothetical protein
MPTITYRLSNRQRKELLVRGRPLAIALPLSSTEPVAGPLALARSLLPEIDGAAGERIIAAEVVLIRVSPGDGRAGSGLTARLGQISDDPARWCVTHEVLVADIVPRRPRGEPLPMQWPAAVHIDGRDLFAPRDAAPEGIATEGAADA